MAADRAGVPSPRNNPGSMGCWEHGFYGVRVRDAITPWPCGRQEGSQREEGDVKGESRPLILISDAGGVVADRAGVFVAAYGHKGRVKAARLRTLREKETTGHEPFDRRAASLRPARRPALNPTVAARRPALNPRPMTSKHHALSPLPPKSSRCPRSSQPYTLYLLPTLNPFPPKPCQSISIPESGGAVSDRAGVFFDPVMQLCEMRGPFSKSILSDKSSATKHICY